MFNKKLSKVNKTGRRRPSTARLSATREYALYQNATSSLLSGAMRDVPVRITPINPIHTFTQIVDLGTITSTAVTGTEVDGALVFTISQCDGAASFLAVFDQYMIDQVIVEFVPIITAPTQFSQSPGELYTALDYDDSTALSAVSLRQYNNCNLAPANVPQQRVLRPHVAVAAFGGGAFTSFMNSRPGVWVDSASNTVAHYGVKYASTNSVPTNVALFRIQGRFLLKFRSNI